jgi:hypothetical protein
VGGQVGKLRRAENATAAPPSYYLSKIPCCANCLGRNKITPIGFGETSGRIVFSSGETAEIGLNRGRSSIYPASDLRNMPRRSAASFVIPSVTGAPPRLSPPADLSEPSGLHRPRCSSKAEHFRPSDLPLLSAYCRCIVLERRSAQELAAGDHKALARWEKATKAMVALSMRLRLSPQSRAPNNPSRPSQPEPVMSYYDRMELEGRDESS